MRLVCYLILILSATLGCRSRGGSADQSNQIKTDTTQLERQNIASAKGGFSSNDSTRFLDLYHKAKWIMYCIHCDDTPKWRPEYSHLPSVPFGSLDLRFRGASQKGDTVEIYCLFYFRDTIPCNENTLTNYYHILFGIGFNKVSGEKLYFNRGDANFVEKGMDSRYANELQPSVISFIKRNENNLNPWFRSEAVKRGIIH
jgi:hypothetical protein